MKMPESAYYNENDPFAAQWLRNLIDEGLIAPGHVDGRDIREVKGSDLDGFTQHHFFAGVGGWSYALRLAGWPDDRPVATASCPCQPFSNAGHGRGVDDDRHLWPAFRWLYAQRKFPVLFGEQVASAAGLKWFDGVRRDLEALGAFVGAGDIPAVVLGAKHKRHRLWFTAYASGLNGRAHDRVVSGGIGGSQVPTRRLPRLDVSGGWWQKDSGPERMPTLVRNHDGLSGMLAGFGNAIVPQVAAEFIRASDEAMQEAAA